ncbi:MAG: hypothetical protein M3P10_05890 [Actinomycetota bacterium]|nr:hypothetical protein [Actinomycetota bacterium]
MTTRSRRIRSSGRRCRDLAGVVVAIAALGLPASQTPAVAAQPGHSFPHHALPAVVPRSFNGDVRDLSPVPSAPLDEPEMDEPAPSKAPAGDPASVTAAPNMPAPAQTFAGLSHDGACTGGTCGAGYPPDTVGDVGPNHYVEAVNTAVGIYGKTGTELAAFTFNSLWSGAGTGTACDTANRGDPTVVYDPIGNRWFVADFAFASVSAAPYYECVAVSKTGNPVTGGWWLYAIQTDDASHPYLPDYPKMAIWPDGLYMTANMFDCRVSCSYREVRIWAFNRVDLEAGTFRGIVVDIGSATYYSMLPSNLRGASPPAGAPNYLVSESQSGFAFQVFKFHVDWANPGSSTFTGPTTVSQTSYAFAQGDLVPQPGTTTKLDSLEDRLMMQAQYRNISGTESLWVSHTVGNGPTGVQWAQINVTGGTVRTTPVQQQIWTNVNGDGVSRWMPSLAVDHVGNMALGYSASSGSVFPSIRYAGRLATDTPNTLGQGEATLFAGTGSQVFNCGGAACHRWGDYTSMSVDPQDDCTFWYVGEYYTTTGSANWRTRIGSFTFPSCSSPGGSANLSITKTDAPDPVRADSPLTYTLTVANAGASGATSVVVTDTLPANVMFGSAIPSQGSCGGTTTVSCDLGSIANGGNATVAISITPIAPGTISNTASVSATESDPNPANNSASQSTTVKAQAKTKYVAVTDPGFTPLNLAVQQGTTVQWNFFGPSSNSVSDATGMGLFSSGPQPPVSYLRYTYAAAGQYAVVDALQDTSTVKVALIVAPASGTVATPFTVTWSSTTAPSGLVFDVQVRRPGTSTWANWRTAQTGSGAVFTPDAGTGTYRFRARMRRTAGGSAVYSAAKSITVG